MYLVFKKFDEGWYQKSPSLENEWENTGGSYFLDELLEFGKSEVILEVSKTDEGEGMKRLTRTSGVTNLWKISDRTEWMFFDLPTELNDLRELYIRPVKDLEEFTKSWIEKHINQAVVYQGKSWYVSGRTGRWIILGSDDPKAGCIKEFSEGIELVRKHESYRFAGLRKIIWE